MINHFNIKEKFSPSCSFMDILELVVNRIKKQLIDKLHTEVITVYFNFKEKIMIVTLF